MMLGRKNLAHPDLVTSKRGRTIVTRCRAMAATMGLDRGGTNF